MTGSGNLGDEPPARSTDPTSAGHSFFGGGNTAVYVEPAEAAAGGGDQFVGPDDELDSEFAPQPRKRLGKLTIGLAALLVAGAGFLGGLQVQQHEGSSSAGSNPFAAAARRGTTGETGTGTGGFGGFGGGAGGTRGGAGGTGTGATGGTGGSGTTGTGGTGGTAGTSSIPAVIGQIVSVSGDTVVVKNLGGQQITVKLSGSTTISQTATAADLKPGQNVTVSGTTGTDGTVTATAVGTH
jgi:hypothetical protein